MKPHCTDAEWQARIDLAACYRLVDLYGMSDMMANHISWHVPGEPGFPGFEAGSWFGFFAPKGTPPEVIATLNRHVNDFLAVPATEAALIKEGADPVGGTPQQFAQFVQREFEKWRAVVKESGATAE
jgi:hypothetical protein